LDRPLLLRERRCGLPDLSRLTHEIGPANMEGGGEIPGYWTRSETRVFTDGSRVRSEPTIETTIPLEKARSESRVKENRGRGRHVTRGAMGNHMVGDGSGDTSIRGEKGQSLKASLVLSSTGRGGSTRTHGSPYFPKVIFANIKVVHCQSGPKPYITPPGGSKCPK